MHAVDLEELAGTVEALSRCGGRLDMLLDDVSHAVRALHLSWSGLAADAQAEAQAEWEAGFRSMRAALDAMREAADAAHDRYAAAAATNLRMWEQVR